MTWPAWARATAYDIRVLAAAAAVLETYGVTLPSSSFSYSQVISLLAKYEGVLRGRPYLTAALVDLLGEPAPAGPPPPETAPTSESAAPLFFEADAWLSPWTFGLDDGYSAELPLHFKNKYSFATLDAGPWLSNWKEQAEAARSSYASGGLHPVDRDLQTRAYKIFRSREQYYEWEQERGLIPDIPLGGESDIKFEGRKLFTAGYSKTTYPGGGLAGYGQPAGDISLEGELQLRVEGTVRRKTHVYVDYDDTRENESRNQVSVVYKGDPGELVQEAAFGDIMLSLPSTEFVSYSSSRAVFGAKVDLQYKWAHLMGVASREKGKTEKATFTGGAELTTLNVADINYTKRRFFLLHTWAENTSVPHTPEYFDKYKIMKRENGQPLIEVFLYPGVGNLPRDATEYRLEAREFDDRQENNEGPIGPNYIPGDKPCRKLKRATEYTVDVNTGVLTLLINVSEQDVLAVAYVIADKNSNAPVNRVGYNDNNELNYTAEGTGFRFNEPLKCIYGGDEGGVLQRYQLKNRYFMGSTNISSTSLTVKILDKNGKDRDEQGKTYLYLFGLDQDEKNGVDAGFIDYTYGYLTVPDLSRSGNEFRKKDVGGWREGGQYLGADGYFDNLPFDYDANGVVEGRDAYPKDPLESRFTLYFEYQSLKPSYFLHPNIIPGSETVTLNGVRLVPNQDYWLDYDSGILNILVEGAESRTAVLEVTYEYKPLFALATKSLVGGRFQFGPDDDRHVGTTFLAEFTEKPPRDEIPKTDEAPANQHIFDVDGRFRVYPEWMTKAADALPVVNTKDGSIVDLQAEYARSFKNPNTVGRAYVDDMEGARLAVTLPMKAEAWWPTSPPASPRYHQGNRGDNYLRLESSYQLLSDVKDGWPDDMLETLRLTALPDNPENEPGKTPYGWAGIQRVLSPTGLDFAEARYEYMEVMLNLNNLTPRGDDDVKGGVLHFDLGSWREDVDGDGRLDTEDGINNTEPNGILDAGEDIGVNLNNTGAGGYITAAPAYGASNKILDTEDNNRNRVLDEGDDYFTYAVNLAEVINGTNPYVIRSPRSKSPLKDGWYILRIPFDFDDAVRVGAPDPSKIQVMRIWVEARTNDDFPRVPGAPKDKSSVYLGAVTYAAMKWEEPILKPPQGLNELKIATKDNRNDDDYVPLHERKDASGKTEREQTLVLRYILTDWEDVGVYEESPGPLGPSARAWGAGNDEYDTEDVNHNGILDAGEDVGVGPLRVGAANGRLDEEPAPEGYTRLTYYSPEDFSRYRRLELYVWDRTPADGGGRYSDNDIFFVRFGGDDENYYEYFEQTHEIRDWEQGHIVVNLERFLDLQTKGYQLLQDHKRVEVGHYRVVGDPSLVNISEINVGVRTKVPRRGGGGGFLDYRELWVNDVILADPVNDVGEAKKARVSFDFGNFVALGGGVRDVGAGFEQIGTTSAARSSSNTRDVNAKVELAKFFPYQWNLRLPLSGGASRSETVTEDKYDPKQSIYNRGRTVSLSRNLGLSFSKYKLPSWNVNYRNSDAVNYRYSRLTETENWSAGVDYEVFPRKRWLPVNVRTNFERMYQDITSAIKEEAENDRHWVTDDNRNSIKWEPLEALEITPGYDYSSTRDRTDGAEQSFNETYSLHANYFRVRGLRPAASYTSSYRETVLAGAQPPSPLDGPTLRPGDTMTLSLNANFNTSVPVSVGDLTNNKAVGLNKWSVTPSYELTRSSSYQYQRRRAPGEYRWGRRWKLADAPPDEFVNSRIRHAVTLNNRLNPLEFLGERKGTKWETWDFIQADVDYAYSHELSDTTGTPSLTISQTFPDVTLQLYGTRNFPLFAAYLDRSTVVLGYYRKKTYQQYASEEIKEKPNASWRATWTREFRTRADYDYTVTRSRDRDENDDPVGDLRTVTEIHPALTLYYDLALPKGFKIPLLGTIRWRNELNLTAGVAYTEVQSKDANTDSSKQWDYTLSGGYYLTTNLRADVSGTMTRFTNLTQAVGTYTSVGVNGNFEIIF